MDQLWQVLGYWARDEAGKPATTMSETLVAADQRAAETETLKRWRRVFEFLDGRPVITSSRVLDQVDGHRVFVEPRAELDPSRQIRPAASGSPTRPVLRYHGGKWKLAKWIIEHLPPHDLYAEPFAGAASVLMRKPRSRVEILNDRDEQVVNLFRILRDPDRARELERAVRLTPYARREYELAYDPCNDPIERARSLVIRSYMGFGTTNLRRSRSGFRGRMYTGRRAESLDFARWPDEITSFVERLDGVMIECMPALKLIEIHDSPGSLFYCDPPYPMTARTSHMGQRSRDAYACEMTDADHEELARALHGIRGMAVISGYACPLYDELYIGWERVERRAWADGAKERTECLWLSPRVSEARRRGQLAIGI